MNLTLGHLIVTLALIGAVVALALTNKITGTYALAALFTAIGGTAVATGVATGIGMTTPPVQAPPPLAAPVTDPVAPPTSTP